MGCCVARDKIDKNILNSSGSSNPFDDQTPTPFGYNSQYQTAKWNMAPDILDEIEQAALEEANQAEKKKITIENENNNSKFIDEIENMSYDSEISNIHINMNNSRNNGNNPYTSINSMTIQGKSFQSDIIDTSNSMISNGGVIIEKTNTFTQDNPINYILTDTIYFFVFDIQNFVLHEKNYLMNMYPELNVIMTLEINDDKTTTVKIPFAKSSESKGNVLFFPLMPKGDIKENNCSAKILIPFIMENGKEEIFKISLSFFTYTSHKLLILCNDDLFIRVNNNDTFQKINLHQNFYLKHYNKKIGNLIYEYSYMCKDIKRNTSIEERERLNEEIMLMYNRSNSLSKFEIEYLNILTYYKIEDDNLFEDTPEDKKMDFDEYVTIGKLNTDVQGIITKNSDNLCYLMSIIPEAKKKYDIYLLLQTISLHFQKSEFTFVYNCKIKEYIFKILQRLQKNEKFVDDIFIPFLFSLLKLLIFKLERKKTGSLNSSRGTADEKEKSDKLIINIFVVSFQLIFINNKVDIALSALNFLSRYLEDSHYDICIQKKSIKGSDYFFKIVLEKKFYVKLFDVYLKYFDYQACSSPLTNLYAKILSNKTDKGDKDKIITFFKSNKVLDIIKKSLKIFECNSLIITNIYQIYLFILLNTKPEEDKKDASFYNSFFATISIQKMRENFILFRRNGWETLHETSIQLLKSYLSKKSLFEKENIIKLKEEEIYESAILLSFMLLLMIDRIKKLKFDRIIKIYFTFLSHINSLSIFFLNNCGNFTKNSKIAKIFTEKNIIETIIEVIGIGNRVHIFTEIDSACNGNIFDINLINSKITILRTLNGIFSFIKFAKSHLLNKKINNEYIKKINQTISDIKQNDRLNPSNLKKEIERKGFSDKEKKTYIDLHNILNDYYQKFISTTEEAIL